MRAFGIRVLKNGLPVAVLLALSGYGLSQMAEMMVGRSEKPNPDHVPALSDYLQYKLPLAFAAWGFGMVVALEALFSLWRQSVPPITPKPEGNPQDEAEQLLLKLLAEADAAEKARSGVSPTDSTPPPRLGAIQPDATPADVIHSSGHG